MNRKYIHLTGRDGRNQYITLLLLLMSCELPAESTPPDEHIHYLAEHLAEAVQDARYYAMPWPSGDYSSKGWKPLASVAGSRINADFVTATGSLLTLGLSKNWSANWASQFVIYYDRFHLTGSQGSNSLLPFTLNDVPLDLPESALFSNPDGDFTHSGAGIIVSHQLDIKDSIWKWDILGGVLVEKMQMDNFTFEYTLTGGVDAGAKGILDHSGDLNLFYYVVGIQARKKIAEHYTIIPRFIYGRPKQSAEMQTRLTGPGFELTTESTGAKPGSIGDQFAYIGMTLRDTHSNFEMDIGAIAGYAIFEYVAHEGVKSAIIISLTWRL